MGERAHSLRPVTFAATLPPPTGLTTESPEYEIYEFSAGDGSKYSRFVGENVIRGTFLKMENVIKDKSDEVIM